MLSRDIETLTAFHEAAHAVVGYLYGWKISDVSIEPKGLDQAQDSSGSATVEILKSQATVRSTGYTHIPHYLRVVGAMVAGMVGEEISGILIHDRIAFAEDLRYAWLYAYLSLNPHSDPAGAKAYNRSLNRYFETGHFHGRLGRVVRCAHRDVHLMLAEPTTNRTLQNLSGMLLEEKSIGALAVNTVLENLIS